MSGGEKHPEPPLATIRALARSLLAVLQTRLELLATEFDEERERLAEFAVLAAIAAVCFSFAAFLVVLFIVVLFWDSHRLTAVGALAAGFAGAGAFVLNAIRRRAAERPALFSASLDELRKDQDTLREPPR